VVEEFDGERVLAQIAASIALSAVAVAEEGEGGFWRGRRRGGAGGEGECGEKGDNGAHGVTRLVGNEGDFGMGIRVSSLNWPLVVCNTSLSKE